MNEDQLRSLRASLRAIQRRLRREVAPAGISRSAFLTLGSASRLNSAATPSAIAADVDMTSSNVSAALRELTVAGFITRTRDADDTRRTLIGITAAGHEMLDRTRSERTTWLGNAISIALTADEQDALLAAGDLLARVAAVEL